MNSFNFNTTQGIIFGNGVSIKSCDKIIDKLGNNIFLITDPGLTKIGLNKSKSIWAYIIGTILVYIPAIIWLSIFDFGWPKQGMMLAEAVYPFLIGDMIKAIVASLFTVAIGYTNLQRFINK